MTKDLYWEYGLDKKYDPNVWETKRDLEINDRKAWHKEWLIDAVNNLKPELVIDAGCGNNKWKRRIKNLVGFDASPFPNIDFQSTILEAEFIPESADAVLLLGSLQFFNREYIEENLAKVITWVKQDGLIFVRVIKEWEDYTEQQLENMFKHHYFWSVNDIEYFSNKFNLEVVGDVHTLQKQKLDRSNGGNPFRLYWVWRKI